MEQENGSAFSTVFPVNKRYVPKREVQMHTVRVSPGTRSECYVSEFQVLYLVQCSFSEMSKLGGTTSPLIPDTKLCY